MRAGINEVRVHYLRDAHELKEKYPQDAQLFRWAASVKAIYEQAVAWAEQGPDPQLSLRQQQQARVAQQHAFEQQLLAVCRPYVRTTSLNISYVSGSSASYPSCSSLSRYQEFRRTTIWPSAAFAPW